jgi:DNA repair protein RecO (recombination protein O)
MEEKTEGLLLQTVPYLGQSRILKIFSKKEGLITLFTKKKNLNALGSPFCIGEWAYKKGKGDMDLLQDGSLIDPLLDLRKSFAALSAAGSMAQDILTSQLPAQEALALYELLRSYFKKLPQFIHPEILAISFRLKLLLLEGLLSLKNHCAHCRAPANHLCKGESFCASHAPFPSISFTFAEWQQLHCLAFAQKFSLLQELKMEPSFIKKSYQIE